MLSVFGYFLLTVVCSVFVQLVQIAVCSFCTVYVRLGPYSECRCFHEMLNSPANVVPDAGQELPDCPAASDAILAEREEASLQTDVLASDSLPRWLTDQVLSD